MEPVVIAVVGYSDSGKTSLLESLIPALAARGLSVGAVKHASHGFAADRPGKDSHRLYTSGAAAVALVSHEALACFVRREAHREDASLTDALRALPDDLDVVLAEGFSWEPIPRIVVVRPGEDPAVQHVARGPVLRVVSAPRSPAIGPPRFPDAIVESLATRIVSECLGRRCGPRRAAQAREEVR